MSIDNLTTNLISVVLGTVTGFLIGYLIIIVSDLRHSGIVFIKGSDRGEFDWSFEW
jgi:hypothetical protein